MYETYIQTIRGGIQHFIYFAKDYWTETPKPCGVYYHHEIYGYIRVLKLYELIRDACKETYMGWEEYAWVCYENHWLTIEQMAKFIEDNPNLYVLDDRLYNVYERKSLVEQHRTVGKVFIDVDGTEYWTL